VVLPNVLKICSHALATTITKTIIEISVLQTMNKKTILKESFFNND
jgi:hypothetical protein